MQLESLLERCRDGDELAWEALVRRYQGRVYAIAYHYLHDREEARDMAQETFVRIYRSLHGFDGTGSFLAWVVRIARNACFDRMRKLRSLPAYGGEPVEDREVGPDPAPGPEESTARRERQDLLRRALDRMTEINREMILLKEIHGLKQREIADLLSIPLGTVKARTNRARLELATRMLELDPGYGA